jgi:hypothetical protein
MSVFDLLLTRDNVGKVPYFTSLLLPRVLVAVGHTLYQYIAPDITDWRMVILSCDLTFVILDDKTTAETDESATAAAEDSVEDDDDSQDQQSDAMSE